MQIKSDLSDFLCSKLLATPKRFIMKKQKRVESPRHYVIYTYDLTKTSSKSKKVRFVYLLKGRKREKGLVKKMCGDFLVPGCFIIPIRNDEEMQEVFAKWNIPYKRKEVLLL